MSSLAAGLGPLDEGDAPGAQVVLQQLGILCVQTLQAIEVQVRDGDVRAAVAVPDAEGRAGDGTGDAERPGGAADEGGLAGAELAVDEHQVARAQLSGQLGPEGFGLCLDLRSARCGRPRRNSDRKRRGAGSGF